MAQTGYTPILLYSSSTVSQAPSASNLTNSTLGSELAINITDGKLFYKDNTNAVQVIGWKTVPTSAGGTGLTSYTAGDLLYYASGTALTKLAIGTSTTVLTSSGSAPQWTAQSSLSVGTATNLAGGLAGSVPYQSGAGATTFLGIGAANTVLTSSGTAPQWSTALTVTSVTATNLKTSPAAANLDISGSTIAAAGSNTNIDISVTPKGTGRLITTGFGTNGVANLGNNGNNLSGGGYTHRISGRSISPDGSSWFSSYGAVIFNAGSDYTGNARRYLLTNAVDQRNFAIIRSVDATTDPTLGNGGSVSSGFADFVITNTGNVQVGTGNLVISTAGKGVDFSANSHAAGMTSDLLDWYEEGTWTPTLLCTDGAFTSVTYDPLRGGSYTRVGNVVHLQCYMRTDAVNNTVGRTADVIIGGLPFAAVSGTGGTLNGHCSLAVSVASAWAGEEPLAAFISGGDTNIQLLYRTAVDGNTANNVAADVGTGANANIVLIGGTYICA
jgi:hypothetical protein